MDIPVNEKKETINGKEFLVKKFDARTGSYIAFKLVKIITPILSKLDKNSDFDNINYTELLEGLFDLPKEEFEFIQDSCLSSCYYILPGNTVQVLNENKEWGDPSLEYDTALAMELTVKALIFNVKGFFPEKLLDSIKEKLNS
jgi:hypothetical protein